MMKTDDVRRNPDDADQSPDGLQSMSSAEASPTETVNTEVSAFARRPTKFRKIYRLSDL